MFWLARAFGNPMFAESEHAEIVRRSASPQHVVWYVPATQNTLESRELDRYFRGPVEVAISRSAWNDPEALWVGVKAGYNQVNHGHLDLGNFELDALGVRWARDLGADDYNMEGYWSKGRGGQRWSYYRLNSKSHNVCLLNGEDQDPMAKASFVKLDSQESSAFALIDLTSAYEKYAGKVTRGVAMLEGRKAVLVQDEFEIEKPCELVWAMTTDAKIAIEKEGTARLTLNGKELVARVLSPDRAEFTTESAERKAPEKANKGVRRLIVKVPQAKGNVTVAVQLCPVWNDGGAVNSVPVKPLAEW
jgi:hypothetical protein